MLRLDNIKVKIIMIDAIRRGKKSYCSSFKPMIYKIHQYLAIENVVLYKKIQSIHIVKHIYCRIDTTNYAGTYNDQRNY